MSINLEAAVAETPAVDLSAEPAAQEAAEIQQTPVPEVQEEKETVPAEGIQFAILQGGMRVQIGKTVKMVSLEEGLAALLAHFNKLSTESSGKGVTLPPGVFYFEQGPRSLRLATYHPGMVRNVNYRDRVLPRVTPNVMVAYDLAKEGKFFRTHNNTSVRYYSTQQSFMELRKDRLPTIETAKLLPFSNVYDNATLCTGSNHLPNKFPENDLSALHAWFNVLWDSPFNTDLGVKAAQEPYRGDPSAWFDLLAKEAEKPNPAFPYHLLR